MLFTEPTETRYDLRFSLAGFPVRVHPLFWLIAVLLGASGNFIALLIWVAAVFVSILIHELGHALSFRAFGQASRVVLYHLGGLTIPETPARGWRGRARTLDAAQEILVFLAGPAAGFLLAALLLVAAAAAGGSVGFVLLFGVLPLPSASLPLGGRFANQVMGTLLWINVFWGLFNLLPILPLDGGQVARRVLVMTNPRNGVYWSLWVSVVVAGAVALAGLVLFRSVYMTLLFGVLALQSYMMLQGRTVL